MKKLLNLNLHRRLALWKNWVSNKNAYEWKCANGLKALNRISKKGLNSAFN